MNMKLMKRAFATGVALSLGIASAQEAEDPIAAAAAAAVAQVQQAAAALPEATVKAVESKAKADNPAPTPEEMKKDEGVQTVVQVQDAPQKPEGNPRKMTAKEMVEKTLKSSGIKYRSNKNRIIQIVDIAFPAADPEKDKQFFVKRDQFAKLAVLKLKGQIAQSVGQVFSAKEQAQIFGDDTNSFVKVSSASESVAKWPLFGVTVLAQAESWDGKDYHVAVAGVWSKVLHRAAKATLLGEKIVGAAGKKTVEQWLEETDLSLVCGPRQMVDENGNRVFLGIAAREVGINAARGEANKVAAQASANASLIFSLFADVEQRVAHAAVANISEQSGTSAASASETVDRRLAQSVERRAIAGACEIYGGELDPPLTGKRIYVSVYGLDAESAANARVMAEELIATRVAVELANKNALGRWRGYQDKVDAAKADQESFSKGRAEGRRAIEQKMAKPKSRLSAEVAPAAKPAARASQGTLTGEGTISDDF